MPAAIAAVALYPVAKLATAQPSPSFLFVQSAKTIDYKDGVMTLHGVPPQTMFFTDRPPRVVGNLPTDRFVARWTTDKSPNGFATNPPNAAVTLFQPDGAKTAIVELSKPASRRRQALLQREGAAGHRFGRRRRRACCSSTTTPRSAADAFSAGLH